MNLHAAIEAARAESVEHSAGHPVTRDRVLEASARSPRRRVHAVIAAVIASMFGATAFAWYARAPQVVPSAPPSIERVPVAAAASEAPAVRERHVATVERVQPVASVASIDHHEERTVQRTEPARLMRSTAPEAPVASSAPDRELALYAEAHRLHFRARDPAAALIAWDRYLAIAPQGRLAPEARFNRLVALVRLERWADAAAAIDDVDPTFRPRDVERLRGLVAAHAR